MESQPMRYRDKWTIYYDPPPIGSRVADFQFAHDDYDGAEDSGDIRCGFGPSAPACCKAIDAIEEELHQ